MPMQRWIASAAGGTSPEAVASAARSEIASLPKVSGSSSGPGFGQAVMAVLNQADTLMKAWGDTYLSVDALILALAEKGCADLTRLQREALGS